MIFKQTDIDLKNVNCVVQESDIEKFKINILNLFKNTIENSNADEKQYVSWISNFFTNILGNNYKISSTLKPKCDLVIEDDYNKYIIFEIKTQRSNEMIKDNNFNVKSLHEVIWYFMNEIYNKNNDIKWLIVTDVSNWYFFDAQKMYKIFCKDNEFKKNIADYINRNKTNNNTINVYKCIEKYINDNNDIVEYSYICIGDIETIKDDDIKLLYNIFSENFLLKKSNNIQSASLNKNFYKELLYILGLQESKINNRVLIQKNSGDDFNESIIENIILRLKTEKNITDENELFNISLELCIIWLNRILFLKLLEGQLLKFNNNDNKYAFLNSSKIKDFDNLYELFFNVLAKDINEREEKYRKKYENVPYLNSSLFEQTELEQNYISINELSNDNEMKLYKNSILKIQNKYNKNNSKINTLNYLLMFLDSYDFSSDINKKIQNNNRDIINASVLGLIFEKINGYKDGSYYTPEYITTYMCEESIRQAIAQKFIDEEKKDFKNFDEVKNYCINAYKQDDLIKFNNYINSLKICDPAVGSGHFLVSSLNAILSLKSELNILADEKGNRIPNLKINIENNELNIIYNNEHYEYDKNNEDNRNIQEFLFNEKKHIIENCLFGVDINSKSVQITRLRLWIELLKNAYYKSPDYIELETLPNIDINIKCGNSLISKFNLDDNKNNSQIKDLIKEYKAKVNEYKNCSHKKIKNEIKKEIESIKNEISLYANTNINELTEIKNKQKELKLQANQLSINFDEDSINKNKNNIIIIEFELKKLQDDFDKKYKDIYGNSFEWRYEFPEILDDDGNYIGFDVLISNPPYIQLQLAYNDTMKYADLYKIMNYETFDRTGDIYCLFFERGIQISKDNGILCYISSNKWMRAGYGEKLRNFFLKNNPLLLLDLGPGIFESAGVDTCIMMLQKLNIKDKYSLQAVTITKEKNLSLDICDQVKENAVTLHKLTKDAWFIGSEADQKLKEKIEHIGKPLKDWNVKIYRGIITGLNEAFIIDNTKRQEILDNCKDEDERRRTEAIIKPILRGRDIKRYYYEWAGLWVIVIPAGWTNEKRKNEAPEFFIECQFPSLIKYLKNFETKAKKRDDQGDYWWELRACAYYPEFEKEKVVWAETDQSFNTVIVPSCMYLQKTCFMIITKIPKIINAFLNSSIIQWYIRKRSSNLGEKGMSLTKQTVETIPIPPITSSNQHIVSQIESLVDKILAAKKTNHAADTTAWEKEIDRLVYKLYELTDEEIRIIEGVNEVNI